MHPFRTLDDLDVSGKTVLVRADLNVPMKQGRITDLTRITKLVCSLSELLKKRARVVCMSHFDRPGGKYTPSMSLAPVADGLSEALGGRPVRFAVDCIGPEAKAAVAAAGPGEIVLLENLRFHPGEEANDAAFARELASLGELYVNDAFSASHRAHASIAAITQHLPAAAGRLMQAELEALSTILEAPQKPLAAIVGGSKISTKLALLGNLVPKVDVMIVGGAMANTFLHAKGVDVGASMCEREMKDTALAILKEAEKSGCRILLPQDATVARAVQPRAACEVVGIGEVPKDGMILDIGPRSLAALSEALSECKTVLWNGPVGVFETGPFDAGTVMLARSVAALTRAGKVKSIAGGGDTASALAHAGLAEAFTYLSAAGGAFLEWLEGQTLPGVQALYDNTARKAACA